MRTLFLIKSSLALRKLIDEIIVRRWGSAANYSFEEFLDMGGEITLEQQS